MKHRWLWGTSSFHVISEGSYLGNHTMSVQRGARREEWGQSLSGSYRRVEFLVVIAPFLPVGGD
jgi:hypothetical protein